MEVVRFKEIRPRKGAVLEVFGPKYSMIVTLEKPLPCGIWAANFPGFDKVQVNPSTWVALIKVAPGLKRSGL